MQEIAQLVKKRSLMPYKILILKLKKKRKNLSGGEYECLGDSNS